MLFVPSYAMGQKAFSDTISVAQNTSDNTLKAFYITGFSKTNFKNLERISSSYFKNLIEDEPPTQPFLSRGYGLHYYRNLSNKWGIGTGFQYSIYGQQSTSFLGTNDIGTYKIKLTYKSLEVPVSVRYFLASKRKLKYHLNGSIIANIYHRVYAQDFVYRSFLDKEDGCCQRTYFHSTGVFFEELGKHFNDGLWRLGFSFGGGVSFPLFPHLSLYISPEFKIYTSMFKTNKYPTIVKGGIVALDLQTGVSFDF